VSTLSRSRRARPRTPRFQFRRSCRFSLECQPLELRQLLSVFQGGSFANLGQSVAKPDLPAAPLVQGSVPSGLSPSQVATAYGVNQIAFGSITGNGAGQTIAIIDAYFDRNITSDLAQFDSQFGLAAPPEFTQYAESGLYANNSGWALETALDVEWAHAIAPGANIVLV
jgi:subtilase family serine protease